MHPSVREVAVLQEATQMILASVDVETVLHQILLIVRNYFEVFNSSIYSVENGTDQLYCRAQNGYQTPAAQLKIAMGTGVIGQVAKTGKLKYVPDVRKEPLYLEGNPAVRSELALPLMVRDSAVGVLDIESDQLDYFTEDMVSLLGLFAGQAAIAVENARLYSSERKRMRQIELINLIARSATSASDATTFLNAAAELVADTFDGCAVGVVLKSGEHLELVASIGLETDGQRISQSGKSGLMAQAFEQRSHALVDEISPDRPVTVSAQTSGSELVVPMIALGETLGALVVGNQRPHHFSADDRAVAQAAADVSATAVRNIQLGAELHQVTHTDFLTGLYNQRHFHNATALEIVRCRRYHKSFSVVMFDIHHFHDINIALGFNAGDELLRHVATTLRSHVRNNDILCRYAGDRFAIVLPETDADHVDSIMAKIQEVLCRIEFLDHGRKQRLAAACGSASYPQDGSTELELIRKLQERLGHSKSGGATGV